MMTVTRYNESVAVIRRKASLLLDAPSKVYGALTEGGLSAEAVAKLPPMLEGETETRLKELVARAPIELGRDLRFVERASEEFLNAADRLLAAWDAYLKAAEMWDEMVAAGQVHMYDAHTGEPIPVRPRTAFEKAAEAQRARSKLRLVRDDDR